MVLFFTGSRKNKAITYTIMDGDTTMDPAAAPAGDMPATDAPAMDAPAEGEAAA